MFSTLAMVRNHFVKELDDPISRYPRSYTLSMIGAVDMIIARHYEQQDRLVSADSHIPEAKS